MHIGLLITKHISDFLYYAHGKWYFIFWFGMAGLNQAEWADFWLEVSLSTGILKKIQNIFCDQEAYVHIWWNSRLFWFFRLTLMNLLTLPLWKIIITIYTSYCKREIKKRLQKYTTEAWCSIIQDEVIFLFWIFLFCFMNAAIFFSP